MTAMRWGVARNPRMRPAIRSTGGRFTGLMRIASSAAFTSCAQFRHGRFPIPELACLELTLFDLFRQFDSTNRDRRVVESFESEHRPNPLFDSPMVLF